MNNANKSTELVWINLVIGQSCACIPTVLLFLTACTRYIRLRNQIIARLFLTKRWQPSGRFQSCGLHSRNFLGYIFDNANAFSISTGATVGMRSKCIQTDLFSAFSNPYRDNTKK